MAEPQIALDTQPTDDVITDINAASVSAVETTPAAEEAAAEGDVQHITPVPDTAAEAPTDETDTPVMASEQASDHHTETTADTTTETTTEPTKDHTGEQSPQRCRKWHFQPEIHMTIAEQTFPMAINGETGQLEMPGPLSMDQDTLLRFLGGIADGELSALEHSIQALSHFVTIENFSLTDLTVAPTGALSFNLAAHPEPQQDGPVPAMSFDNIRFTVSKELQS